MPTKTNKADKSGRLEQIAEAKSILKKIDGVLKTVTDAKNPTRSMRAAAKGITLASKVLARDITTLEKTHAASEAKKAKLEADAKTEEQKPSEEKKEE